MTNGRSKTDRRFGGRLGTLGLAALGSALLALSLPAHADHSSRPPEVPTDLKVPAGNKLSLHVFADGVQIYTATPSPTDPTKFVWTFNAPEADLFKDDEFEHLVGTHYAGPTWESRNGSKVVAARTAGVIVDPTAIPWLLLEAVSTSRRGIFKHTTFIQRLNTTGGLAPSEPPTEAGQEASVPYTAEYFFYRAKSRKH